MAILNSKIRSFRRWGIITVIAVYILIFVGGIVRSTGSGMGCPDWPRCFGKWVPPLHSKDLPPDYKEIYSQKRKVKNVKVASYLNKLGFHNLSKKILNDPSIYIDELFNPTKTIIEYINRLVGVAIGIFILITVLNSLYFWRSDKLLVFVCFSSFILVGLEGWLGSIVVSTNLLPGLITVHMLLALLIVYLLIFGILKSYQNVINISSDTSKLLISVLSLCIFFTLFQIILGTKVRESTDIVANLLGESKRGEWVNNFGNIFIIHRSFSWLIVLVNSLLYYLIFKSKNFFLLKFSNFLVIIILIEIFTGIIMNYFGIPAFAQPFHLLFASLIFGIQSILLLSLLKKTVINKNII